MNIRTSQFPSTDWSVVLRAKDRGVRASDRALGLLCEIYWQPLYSVLRHRGCSPEDAQDLTQSFLASIVEKQRLQRIVPDKGRFRSFLLTALLNFATNEFHRRAAQKRGGVPARVASLTAGAERDPAREPADWKTPELLFDRRWAATLLDRVMSRLAHDYARTGKADLFRWLQRSLAGSPAPSAYQDAAAALNMSEAAVRVAAHRLRRRYRDLLREEVGQTVSEPTAIDDEIRYLLKVVTHSH